MHLSVHHGVLSSEDRKGGPFTLQYNCINAMLTYNIMAVQCTVLICYMLPCIKLCVNCLFVHHGVLSSEDRTGDSEKSALQCTMQCNEVQFTVQFKL